MSAPDIDGVWRCSECGEMADALDSAWRWTGLGWEHHHGYPVGHCEARYLGSRPSGDAADEGAP